MRRWVAVAALCVSGLARAADDPGAADRAEIRRVITAQIDAFRHDDGKRAYGFASPGIQDKFGDAAHFLSAVRLAYPPVYRPRSFVFGGVTAEDGPVVQKVEIVGPDGTPALALYDMEREADGRWLIAGCRLEKSGLQAA